MSTTAQPASPVVAVSPVSLLARARSLRDEAQHVNPVLASAYRRRAAELRLEAWARAGRSAEPLAGELGVPELVA
jgi:hypothetical protein